MKDQQADNDEPLSSELRSRIWSVINALITIYTAPCIDLIIISFLSFSLCVWIYSEVIEEVSMKTYFRSKNTHEWFSKKIAEFSI